MSTLWNSGSAPEDLIVTIGFKGGDGHYKLPVHLEPGAGKVIDLAEIIRAAKPDADGHLIPRNVQEGGMIISGSSGLPEKINVVVSEGVFSVFGATCFPPCVTCGPGPTVLALTPASLSVPVGGSQQMTATAQYSNGTSYDMTSSTTWTSTNTSVATVSSSGMMNAMAAGSTDIDGEDEFIESDRICSWTGPYICPTRILLGQAPTNVMPTVSFNQKSPNFVLVGTDPAITIYNMQQAVGMPSGGTYAWSGTAGGLSFNPTSGTNADVTTITATARSQSLNDTTLTVNYTLNSVSANPPATKKITMSQFAYLTGPTLVASPIGSGNYGYLYNGTYSIFTDPGQQMLGSGYSDISVPETVSGCSGCTTGPGTTNAASQIVDKLGIVSAQPLPSNLKIVVSQTISVSSFSVRTNTLTFTATGLTVTNNGPTQ